MNYLDVKIPEPFGGYTTYLGVTKKLRETHDKMWQLADKASGWHDTAMWLAFTEEGQKFNEGLAYIRTDLERAKRPFIEYAEWMKVEGSKDQ